MFPAYLSGRVPYSSIGGVSKSPTSLQWCEVIATQLLLIFKLDLNGGDRF